MFEFKEKTGFYYVFKVEDFEKLPPLQAQDVRIALTEIAKIRSKEGKPSFNEYYVINKDEPYADRIFNVIKEEETLKAARASQGKLSQFMTIDRQKALRLIQLIGQKRVDTDIPITEYFPEEYEVLVEMLLEPNNE